MFAMNDSQGILPNPWCICKVELNIIVLKSGDQHITFTIENNNKTFGFFIVYASINYITRRNLWNNLTHCIPYTLWFFIGDFNSITEVGEYQGADSSAIVPMENFHVWLDFNHLIHIPALGKFFT